MFLIFQKKPRNPSESETPRKAPGVMLKTIVLLLAVYGSQGFHPPAFIGPQRVSMKFSSSFSSTSFALSAESAESGAVSDGVVAAESSAVPPPAPVRASIYPPADLDSMINDVRKVVNRAVESGLNRQIVRVPLPRSSSAKDLGKVRQSSQFAANY